MIEATMTLPRLYALRRYWVKQPPAHVLLAAWVGYEPPVDWDNAQRIGSLDELIGLFGGGV